MKKKVQIGIMTRSLSFPLPPSTYKKISPVLIQWLCNVDEALFRSLFMLRPYLVLPWCVHTVVPCAIYKAIATPNIPIAPIKPATTPVGAAPALLELDGAAELDAFVGT